MELTFDQIRAVAVGAERIENSSAGVRFFRFTQEQEALYARTDPGFYRKTFSTAGVRLRFRTDSRTLGLRVSTAPSTTRTFFSFDVFADDRCVGFLDNLSDRPLPDGNPKAPYPLGSFARTFSLGPGEKTVTVWLPWSVEARLVSLTLDDGSVVLPVKREKRLLLFGDSITHGYDTLRPSNHFSAALSQMLGADVMNKAIGAEMFFPALAQTAEPFCPDDIVVAYGTNDWSHLERDVFRENCRAFYAALRRSCPTARIFAISPIWRAGCDVPTACGPFDQLAHQIAQAVEDLENTVFIPGVDLVPKDTALFADRALHPNDAGFAHYGRNLCAAIARKL